MESTLGIGLNSFGGSNDNDGGGIVIVVGGADSHEPDGGDARADEGQGRRLRPNSESIKLKGKYPSGASGSGSETELKWLAPLFRFKLLLGHTLDEWGWSVPSSAHHHHLWLCA